MPTLTSHENNRELLQGKVRVAADGVVFLLPEENKNEYSEFKLPTTALNEFRNKLNDCQDFPPAILINFTDLAAPVSKSKSKKKQPKENITTDLGTKKFIQTQDELLSIARDFVDDVYEEVIGNQELIAALKREAQKKVKKGVSAEEAFTATLSDYIALCLNSLAIPENSLNQHAKFCNACIAACNKYIGTFVCEKSERLKEQRPFTPSPPHSRKSSLSAESVASDVSVEVDNKQETKGSREAADTSIENQAPIFEENRKKTPETQAQDLYDYNNEFYLKAIDAFLNGNIEGTDVTSFMENSKILTNWVTTDVISQHTPEESAKSMEWWLKVMVRCIKKGDFFSAGAILASFNLHLSKFKFLLNEINKYTLLGIQLTFKMPDLSDDYLLLKEGDIINFEDIKNIFARESTARKDAKASSASDKNNQLKVPPETLQRQKTAKDNLKLLRDKAKPIVNSQKVQYIATMKKYIKKTADLDRELKSFNFDIRPSRVSKVDLSKDKKKVDSFKGLSGDFKRDIAELRKVQIAHEKMEVYKYRDIAEPWNKVTLAAPVREFLINYYPLLSDQQKQYVENNISKKIYPTVCFEDAKGEKKYTPREMGKIRDKLSASPTLSLWERFKKHVGTSILGRVFWYGGLIAGVLFGGPAAPFFLGPLILSAASDVMFNPQKRVKKIQQDYQKQAQSQERSLTNLAKAALVLGGMEPAENLKIQPPIVARNNDTTNLLESQNTAPQPTVSIATPTPFPTMEDTNRSSRRSSTGSLSSDSDDEKPTDEKYVVKRKEAVIIATAPLPGSGSITSSGLRPANQESGDKSKTLDLSDPPVVIKYSNDMESDSAVATKGTELPDANEGISVPRTRSKSF